MRKPLIATAVLLVAFSAPGTGKADDTGAVSGAVAGAVVGAVVGGPIGAVIGAGLGGVVAGAATGPNTYAGLQPEHRASIVQQPGLVDRRSARVVQEPLVTGSVIETTCVRDRRGNTRCRNEVVR
jgi:hypothetical protein